MKRESIQPEHIDAILKMVSEVIYLPEKVTEIESSGQDFPFIHALLWSTSEKILQIFRVGSLGWDLERVAGLGWKWDVSVDQQGHLRIEFRENRPLRDKTEEQLEEEDRLNRRVAEYLQSQTIDE